MYKFNMDNIIVGYIKELLHNFNLPKCDVVPQNKKDVCLFRRYIENNKIVYYDSFDILGEPSGRHDILTYFFNDKVQNLTRNLKLDSSQYDTYTHEYLGDYLRFIRDFTGLNMMPLYNCYSNKLASNISFNTATDNGLFVINTDDPTYKYYLVKVKFGLKYTIGLDCEIPYEVCCMIYTGDQVTQLSKDLVSESHKRFPCTSFRNPVLYNVPRYNDLIASETGKLKFENCWQFELNLYMLIKLPAVAKTSIAILEGDYRLDSQTIGNVLTPYYGGTSIDTLSDIQSITRLSLLRNNAKDSYAFADRLVEYLVRNVIDLNDKIGNNISSVKLDLVNLYGSKDLGIKSTKYGLWELGIRKGACLLADEESSLAFAKVKDIRAGSKEGKTTYMKRFRNRDFNCDLLWFIDSSTEGYIALQLNKKKES